MVAPTFFCDKIIIGNGQAAASSTFFLFSSTAPLFRFFFIYSCLYDVDRE